MPYKDKSMKSLRQRDRRVKSLVEAPALNEAPIEAPPVKYGQIHPAIVRALTDPKIRPKIERISDELNSRGLGNDVRYGTDGPCFDVVKELLEVTK